MRRSSESSRIINAMQFDAKLLNIFEHNKTENKFDDKYTNRVALKILKI